MIIEKSSARGKVFSPPSKSMAHRHLICAAFSEGKSVVHNIDFSEDIKATISCLKELGAEISVEKTENANDIIVHGIKRCSERSVTFNCNESGSTLRFFIPIAYYFGLPSLFIGSKVLMTRPQDVYEKIAKEQNLEFSRTEEGIRTSGKLKGGDFEIPGNISSQFVTGLLYVLPLLREDSTLHLTGGVESKPYIDMTLQVQKLFGVTAVWSDETTLKIPGNQRYIPCESTVEGDYSNAAFFDAFNFIGNASVVASANASVGTSEPVEVLGLNEKSLQGDKIYHEYFSKLRKGFCTLDITNCPDLGPILFVVAAANSGAEFIGTKRLKIKESDRGKVMCEELKKFGVQTTLEEERIVIKKSSLASPSETICGHNDHRIVMSLSTLLTLTGGKISEAHAVRKSFPEYFKKLSSVGIKLTAENGEEDLL